MNKIGIMTFHNAMSYGAVLQAYALEKSVEKIGCDAEVIDYTCPYIYNTYVRVFPKTKNIKFNIKMSLMGRKRYMWRKHLQEFRKNYLKQSRPVGRNELKKLAEDYNIVISGSDQVFKNTCTDFDPSYFLDFVPDEKKYTYAASFGSNEVAEEYRDDYRNRLKGFQQLSVREESGCSIVRDLLNRDSFCHIDPTFLLSQSEWNKVEKHKNRKPYILVFSVLKPLKLVDYAIKLGQEKGLDVLYLENYAWPPKKGLKYIDPVGPDGFIGLIKNAEYVVTNSFHGMAFSIIFHKKLAMELDTSGPRNVRSENVLKKLGMSEVEIIDGKLDIDNTSVDWKNVEDILSKEREKSISYLEGICK